MPTLVEKIEASAAARLTLPPGRPPTEELARYRNFLKVESHRLKLLHRAGAGGREICQARAAMIDVLLRCILDAELNSPKLAKLDPQPFALVALGGYGRAELNPHSDLDIMFLHHGERRGRPHPFLAELWDGLFYTILDIGLKFGHSMRTLDDCLREANREMQSKTSLIEARLIAGNKELFKLFQKSLLGKCVEGHEDEYIAARLEDQAARRSRFGNSACMQEPNIKNGCGGLRDYQNLLWMAFFKYRIAPLTELEKRQLISPAERKQLESAYDFLLRVRTDLHYQVNRPADVLTRNLQPTVANNLGWTDRSPSRRLEQFMRALYFQLRHIYLITRTLEQRLALLPQRPLLPSLSELIRHGRRRVRQQLLDGFKIVDREIMPASSRVFRDQPRRLMRVFLHLQQRGLKLHPDLDRLIRQHLSLVDRDFRRDLHVRATFLEILSQRGNVAPVLRAMHDVDLLGKYVPEFGDLTCLVQHEFYHRYTADEHTLVCVEQLDRIWEAKNPPYNHYAEMFKSVEQPDILYLALLLHDAGKARHTGNHSQVGGQLVGRVAKRLGLDSGPTQGLRLLVENHLLMAQVSQRRDLGDPAVIRSFAQQVQSPANLTMLTLLTFADAQGTSEQLWNGFKDALLGELYETTLPLVSGGTDFVRAEEKQRELLAEQVRKQLPRTISDEELEAHFATLPPRYFQIHSSREIARDVTLVHRFMHQQLAEEERALEPVMDWHNEPDRVYSAVKVCTWDRAGLFSKMAGSLSAAGLNILSAQIFTRADDIAVDSFFVTDARTGLLPDRAEREKCEALLVKALTGEDVDFGALIARHKVSRPAYTSLEGERIPTRIHFDNAASEKRTVIELETEDRVGLLYAIVHALSELGLDISVAKISTEKGAAIDTFYVSERDGGKILSPDRQQWIERRLRFAVSRLDEP